MNKSTILFIIIFSIIIISCKKEEFDSPRIKTVSVKPSLNLRESPNSKSKIITSIPYGSIVTIYKKSENQEEIGGIKAHWVYTKWKNYKGWLFYGYLSDYHTGEEDEIKTECSNFKLYTILCFNQNELTELGNKIIENNKELSAFIELKPGMLKKEPDYKVGDTVIVISNSKIYEDKIKSIDLSKNPIRLFLVFHLNNTPYMSGFENKIFIKKDDLQNNFKNYPEIISLQSSDDESEHINDLVIEFLLRNKDKIVTGDIIENSNKLISKSDYKKWLTNYSIIYNEYSYNKKNVHIIHYQRLNDNNINFLSIIINDQVIYLRHSSLVVIFKLGDDIYIALNHWLPRSGCVGKNLYILDDNKLKRVTSDYSYAD